MLVWPAPAASPNLRFLGGQRDRMLCGTPTFEEKTQVTVQKKIRHKTKILTFTKKDDDRRVAYSVVYEPDVKDADDDWATEFEIEKAAHRFMKDYQVIGVMHQHENRGIKLVESWIAKTTFEWEKQEIVKGSWLIGLYFEDEAVWAKVKDGTFGGVSMGGYCELPPEQRAA